MSHRKQNAFSLINSYVILTNYFICNSDVAKVELFV
ncbi:hypothetical protein EVA_04961 [gut metagenome]|uniref:Uncharacterized protein n=1 Tax=gut metagenome TaxID=749906 RepID=J9GIG2_9ZZZZ